MSSVSAITTAGTLGFSVSAPIGYNILTSGLAPIITTDGYALYRFHSSGTMNLSGIVAKYSPATLQVMCVGGGSGGAGNGGSAGGFIETTITLTTEQTINITVGNGGGSGGSGGNTSISFSSNPEYNMIAYGGTITMSGAPTQNTVGNPIGTSGYGGGGGSGGVGGNATSAQRVPVNTGTNIFGGDGGIGKKPTKPGIATQYPTTYWAGGGGGYGSDGTTTVGTGYGGIGGGGGGYNFFGTSQKNQGSNGYGGAALNSPNAQTNSGSGGGNSGTGGSGIVMIAVKVPI
jgi:hypothetical protein